MGTMQPIEILLVEDNPGDARLAVEVLKDGKFANHLSVIDDGILALRYLRHQGEYSDCARPDLILLDLNLPGKDGREVLGEMRADPQLRRIPVVIMTTSDAEADVLKSYDLYANCYIVKPVDFAQFVKVVRGIEDFWLSIVKLPSRLDANANHR
jgi:chemotaxis family two-component system response regulator Rcp1